MWKHIAIRLNPGFDGLFLVIWRDYYDGTLAGSQGYRIGLSWIRDIQIYIQRRFRRTRS